MDAVEGGDKPTLLVGGPELKDSTIERHNDVTNLWVNLPASQNIHALHARLTCKNNQLKLHRTS